MVSDAPAEPKPRRWGVRLLIAIAVLLVLTWAAPIIAAYSPLVSWACDQASAAIGGTVSVGNVSLGWFSPVVINNVEVRDADDRTVAKIPRIESERTLLMLLLERDNLGTFQLNRPKFEITFTGNTSNLETMLAKSLSVPSEPKQADAAHHALPQVRVEVVEAEVNIHDADTKRNWPIQPLSFTAIVFPEGAKTVQVSASGTLFDGVERGALKAEILVENATEANPKATAKLRFASLPLSLTDVFVRRQQADTHLGGSLRGNCNLTATFPDGKPHVECAGELIGVNVTLATPALADPLFIEHVKLPGSFRLDGSKLMAQQAQIDSDFGKISLHGTLDLAGDWRTALDQPEFDLDLDIDLAKVAERLPRTLRLHRDLRLISGRLNAHCSSAAKDGAIVWQGTMRTTEVRGLRGQQMISWTEPIALDFQVRNLAKGMPAIDRLKCSARFLQVEATTGADQFTLTANADLQELAEPLGQFIDLADVKLAGRAGATLQVGRTDKDKENYLVHADAQLKQINLTWLTKQPWQEPLVTATLDARANVGADGTQRIDTADLEVKLGSDVVTLKLTEPIRDLAGVSGAAALRVDGDLARWQARSRSWTTMLDDYRLAGRGSVQVQLRASPPALECSNVNIKADDFRCTGTGVSIQEPSLTVKADAVRWDAKTGAASLTKAQLSCPTVEAKADTVALESATMALRGSVDFAANLARLRQWTQDPARPGEPVSGTIVGRIDLQSSEKQTSAGFNMSLVKFVYGPAAKPSWQEAEIKCVGAGVYVRAGDVVRIDRLKITSTIFDADARGTITQPTNATILDVAGTLAYDLANLEPQLRPLLGKDVKIAGKDVRGFKLTGPLYRKEKGAEMHFTELKGDAAVSWKSLHALGCDIGPAEAKAVVQQGWLQVYPIETTLNTGKLRLQPNLRLDPAPCEVVLLAGPVIEKAKLTPALCAGALAYAMPLLANVAEAEGSLSVSLDGGHLPMSAPTTGELKGTIVLHSATVGANPTLRELGNVLKISTTRGIVKECTVPFYMTQGKVHHSDLELAFPDLTLKSSGAVGLDGSLAIVVETPIPPGIAAAAKLTPAQAKQTIRIPIGGTLDQPRPDARALESITSVLGRSVLENELNKLLQPKR